VRLQARLQVAPYCSHLSEYARRRNRQHDDAIGEQDGLSSARSLAASAASGETNGSSSTRRVGFDHKRAVARSRPPGRIGARSNVCLRGSPRDAPRQSRIGLLKARPTLVLLCHKFRYLFRPAQHGNAIASWQERPPVSVALLRSNSETGVQVATADLLDW
jgi:hypothetical protein